MDSMNIFLQISCIPLINLHLYSRVLRYFSNYKDENLYEYSLYNYQGHILAWFSINRIDIKLSVFL